MRSNNRMTRCYGRLENETEDAYLFRFKPEVSDGIRGKHWVPKSQTKYDPMEKNAIQIPEWLASRLRREDPLK